LSTTFWNTDLNKTLVSHIRETLDPGTVIVLGGPSIDTVASEQFDLFNRLPVIDAMIPLEGELGLKNLVDKFLSDQSHLWQDPLDGVVFLSKGDIIAGNSIGQSLDLSLLPSPYLTGLMTPFMKPPFKPLVQTSRGCPYTCRFCVSGKTRPKLRTFPLDQVKEEITFIASTYRDYPHLLLFIADENFGLFERDTYIAEHIKQVSAEYHFPKSLFFYNDKKFTKTSRVILGHLANMNQIGLTSSLQSENPDTMRSIARKNLPDQDITKAIEWAASRDIDTTTELIFGMPHETRETFAAQLDRAVERGFDSIYCYNLFLMDGIQLNRPADRAKFNLKTKYRLQGPNYGDIGGRFAVEVEEVATESISFDFNDFLMIRQLNFMFYVVYVLRFYRWVFNAAASVGYRLSTIFELFLSPNCLKGASANRFKFAEDLQHAFKDELYDSKEELREIVLKRYVEAGRRPIAPTRLNLLFGTRLIYLEQTWVGEAISTALKEAGARLNIGYTSEIFDPLLELCARERIDPRAVHCPDPFPVEYDVVDWKRTKFRKPLEEFRLLSPRELSFTIPLDTMRQIDSFNREYENMSGLDYYFTALDTITPKSRFLFDVG
jgi:radical SAM superfamily enzyme YgiQ (UPF0313 family)